MRLKIERKNLKNISWKVVRVWARTVQPDEVISSAFWKYLLSTKQWELTDEKVEPKKAEKRSEKKSEKKAEWEKKDSKKKTKKSK